MKYSTNIDIDLPIDRVIELFDDPDNLKHWQPGLQSFELISGEAGQPGARSRLRYQMGKREIEMIETVLTRDLPEEFSGTYETRGVYNKVIMRFREIGVNKTRVVSENEFKFGGIMMKLMSFLMPGAFRKQTQKYLVQFKQFAESHE